MSAAAALFFAKKIWTAQLPGTRLACVTNGAPPPSTTDFQVASLAHNAVSCFHGTFFLAFPLFQTLLWRACKVIVWPSCANFWGREPRHQWRHRIRHHHRQHAKAQNLRDRHQVGFESSGGRSKAVGTWSATWQHTCSCGSWACVYTAAAAPNITVAGIVRLSGFQSTET